MRWTNKGHELDEIGFRFKKIETLYLYGAGEYGRKLYSILRNSNINIIFIDADVKKKSTQYCNCDVQTPDYLMNSKEDKEKFIIVVTMGQSNNLIVSRNLNDMGYIQNKDFFSYDDWMNIYLPIFFWYYQNMIYLKYVDLSVTQYCNLKCKGCSILTPYVKHPKHRDLVYIKKDLELLFRNVDLIETLFLIGGEPLLFPELNDLCMYIGENYNDKIIHVVIATNGMVKINKKLLDCMKQYAIEVQISDYSLNIMEAKEKIDSFCEVLNKEGIPFLRMVDFKWCDYGFLNEKYEEKSNDQMVKFFDDCKIDCRGIADGKLFYCFPAQMVQKVLGMNIHSNLYLDLNEKIDRTEFFEFNMGYSEKGYMDMCRRCNGSYLVNHNYIEVAEQL